MPNSLIQILQTIESQARLKPNNLAIADSREEVNFASLQLTSQQFAAKFRASGVKPGQMVLSALAPRLEFVVFLALLREGASSGSIIPTLPLPKDLNADWLVASEFQHNFPPEKTIIIDQQWIQEAMFLPSVSPVAESLVGESFRVFLESEVSGVRAVKVSLDSLMARVDQVGKFWVPQGPTMCLAQVFSEFGFTSALAELLRGNPFLVVPSRVDQALAVAKKYKIQSLSGFGSEVLAFTLNAKERKQRLAELKHVAIKGQFIPARIAKAVGQQFQASAVQLFGYTETGIVASKPLSEDPNPYLMGLALPGSGFRVVDAKGEALPNGKIGALMLTSEALAEIDETKVEDGWFSTNMNAMLDDNGLLLLAPKIGDSLESEAGPIDLLAIDRELNITKGVKQGLVFPLLAPSGDFALAAAVSVDDDFVAEEAMQSLATKFGPQSRLVAFSVVDHLPTDSTGKASREACTIMFGQKVVSSFAKAK